MQNLPLSPEATNKIKQPRLLALLQSFKEANEEEIQEQCQTWEEISEAMDAERPFGRKIFRHHER